MRSVVRALAFVVYAFQTYNGGRKELGKKFSKIPWFYRQHAISRNKKNAASISRRKLIISKLFPDFDRTISKNRLPLKIQINI